MLFSQIWQEWKKLAVLGGPILITQFAQMANGVIDTVMAGRVSPEDLAGVGIGSSLWIPVFLFFVGTLGAMQPIISGHCGARQLDRVMPVVWQGLYIGAVSTAIMMLILFNVHPVLRALQLDDVTAGIAQGYLGGVAWGAPAMLFMVSMRGLMDGIGHTRVTMIFSVLVTLVNAPLNYMLIHGKLGLPAMGGVGCGWATAVSNWIGAVAVAIYLTRASAYKNFHLLSARMPPAPEIIGRILRIGIPIGCTVFVEVSLFSVIALFLAPLGAVVVAAHQIALNVASLVFMIPLSLGMSLTLRISYLLGAGRADIARTLAFSSLLLVVALACVSAPFMWLLRDHIARLYTTDIAVQTLAAQLLMIAAIFQIVDGLQVAAVGALRGSEDTRMPMFIMLLSFWLITLPLGYVLTFTDMLGEPNGAAGFWLALCVGLSCAAVLMILRLRFILRRSRGIDSAAI